MSRASILAAALLVLLQATQVVAQPVCKPVLTVKGVGFSESINLRRFWTASVDLDTPRSRTNRTASSLNSRLKLRRPICHLQSHHDT